MLGAVYLALAVLGSAGAAWATEPPVVVGEIGTRPVGGADWSKTLRRALEREIALLPPMQAPRSKRFVLAASVVKLERLDGSAGTSCTVSVVVRDQKSGSIRSILEGRARLQGSAEGDDAALVEAAAHAALVGLPDALR
jgi:hypothetical protein